jgi:hypothetical protein
MVRHANDELQHTTTGLPSEVLVAITVTVRWPCTSVRGACWAPCEGEGSDGGGEQRAILR